ncbi:unnamed protein product [Clavelina lepadiformis]|uniref:Sulfotransferase family protein n=1 Tax=Clavelina lepadiformis TaxID=159417 RepID=A0ABP0GN99_CLALP
MKVIFAGFSKTGTKTMQAALTELGYNVYDFVEQYTYLGKEWAKIMTEGGTTEDFRRMFENVDAVTDAPAYYFWDEIHKAFPDAKIVFSMRDEDDWNRSMQRQIVENSTPLMRLLRVVSPSFRGLFNHTANARLVMFGTQLKTSLFKPYERNELLERMSYRRHNAHVLQNAPKDKLLVYNVKEGWEPLCKFLGVDVPSKPFPHKNVRGSIVEEVLAKEPIMIRAKRELIFSITLLIALVSFFIYQVMT